MGHFEITADNSHRDANAAEIEKFTGMISEVLSGKHDGFVIFGYKTEDGLTGTSYGAEIESEPLIQACLVTMKQCGVSRKDLMAALLKY